MTEPDLLILFAPRVDLQGFPPWQIRLTEILYLLSIAITNSQPSPGQHKFRLQRFPARIANVRQSRNETWSIKRKQVDLIPLSIL